MKEKKIRQNIDFPQLHEFSICKLFINIRKFSTNFATFWDININLMKFVKSEQIFSASMLIIQEEITNYPHAHVHKDPTCKFLRLQTLIFHNFMTSKYANYQQISDRLIQIYQIFVILTSISLTFLKLNKYSQLYWYLEEEIIKSQTHPESNFTFFFFLFINRTLKTWVSKFITKQTNPKPLKHLTCLNLWRAREREREDTV